MFPYEAEAITRANIEDRLREATHRRLVREVRAGAPAPKETTTSDQSRRHSRLWRLVHLPHAYT